jgi:ligand-binding sensor domain-containing protein
MRNKYIPINCFFLLFLLIFSTSCVGQEKPTISEEPQLIDKILLFPKVEKESLNSDEQIAEYVVEIFEDSKGKLWFGTMGKGAACYDGKTLTYLATADGLCGNTVASIVEDQQGNIWFGTHSGASKYDGKTFTNFKAKEGLTGMGCNLLVDRSGNIWAGTNNGVFRFDGTSFSEFILPNPIIENPSHKWVAGKIWSLIEDKNGNIWFGRDGYGACKFDPTSEHINVKSFTHFTKKDGLCSNNVSQIVEDKNGNIWFGSLTSDSPRYIKEGGLSRYDGEKFTQFSELEGLSKNDIYSIYEGNDGNIWIGAIGVGAYRYDGKNFTLFKDTDRMDLTQRFGLQGILQDKSGTLWLGFSGGLFRFTGTSIINVTKDGPWGSLKETTTK